MPRRNRRPVSYQPLDLTPAEIPKPKPNPIRADGYRRLIDYRDLERERYERQAKARINKGIDWSVCIVPGCGGSLVYWGQLEHYNEAHRDADVELPICYRHMAVVWAQAVEHYTKNGKFLDAIADVNAAIQTRLTNEDEAEKADHLARTDGDIYFIRLGELVKVGWTGWTRDLAQRLKSYGASAQLLVSYPATRDDETNLHRQLRPALAKGREWYEDGAIIQHYIDEALAKYGEPRTFDYLWTQPKAVVGTRRRR